MANKLLFGYNFGKLSVALIPTYQDKAEKGDWQDVDIDDLSEPTALAYYEYKDQYKAMKAAKDRFEAAARAEFGIAEPVKASKANGKPKQTLVEYLASRQG